MTVIQVLVSHIRISHMCKYNVFEENRVQYYLFIDSSGMVMTP